MSKEFKKVTFREMRAQPMGFVKNEAVYALAVKFDIIGGGQEIICFVFSENALRQIEQAIPGVKEEFARLKKDGAKIM